MSGGGTGGFNPQQMMNGGYGRGSYGGYGMGNYGMGNYGMKSPMNPQAGAPQLAGQPAPYQMPQSTPAMSDPYSVSQASPMLSQAQPTPGISDPYSVSQPNPMQGMDKAVQFAPQSWASKAGINPMNQQIGYNVTGMRQTYSGDPNQWNTGQMTRRNPMTGAIEYNPGGFPAATQGYNPRGGLLSKA